MKNPDMVGFGKLLKPIQHWGHQISKKAISLENNLKYG
jgi:hypothetical protein